MISSIQEQIRQRRKRPICPVANVSIKDTVLITGGIGDVLALESFLSAEQRRRLKTVLYATQKHRPIRELFQACSAFPSLCEHKVVWEDFRHFWHFLRKAEVLAKLGEQVSSELHYAEDWSIEDRFPRLNFSLHKFSGSSFLRQPLATIEHFALPTNYMVIQPYSTDKRRANRDFSEEDWLATIQKLISDNKTGVVINQGQDVIPQHPYLLNLANQTTVCEAVEVLKQATGYIGIDSWLTILAAQLFPEENLAIKSNIEHCYKYKHIYFFPKQHFNFLSSDITKALSGVRNG